MTVDLKNIVQKDQIERMQCRIEEAAKRSAAEKRALELEITTWRDKLADMSVETVCSGSSQNAPGREDRATPRVPRMA